MPSFSDIIEFIKQTASSRGGKVIGIIWAIITTPLVAYWIAKSFGMKPLTGNWETACYFLILLDCLVVLLAFILFILRLGKTKEITSNVNLVNEPQNNESPHKSFMTIIRIIFIRIIYIWLIILSCLIYAVGWIYVWKDLIRPIYQQFTVLELDWDMFVSSYLVNDIAGLVIFTLWVVLPFIIYKQIKKARIAKT
jgi:hypothetical protein